MYWIFPQRSSKERELISNVGVSEKFSWIQIVEKMQPGCFGRGLLWCNWYRRDLQTSKSVTVMRAEWVWNQTLLAVMWSGTRICTLATFSRRGALRYSMVCLICLIKLHVFSQKERERSGCVVYLGILESMVARPKVCDHSYSNTVRTRGHASSIVK